MAAAQPPPTRGQEPPPTPLRRELPEHLRILRDRGLPPLEDRDRVVFEDSGELPPRLRGRSPGSSVTPQALNITPSQRPAAADMRARMRGVALADPRLRDALRGRFVMLQGAWLEPPKGERAAAPGEDRFGLLFYSYTRNRPVRAVLSGDRVLEVVPLRRGEQPPESREEVEAAAALVRSDPRRRRRVGELEARGIQTPAPGRSTNRQLYLTFHRPGQARAEYQATVDMTAGRVLDFRPVQTR